MGGRSPERKQWAERFLTMEQAREALPALAKEFAADQRLGGVIITDNRQPALAVMPWSDMRASPRRWNSSATGN